MHHDRLLVHLLPGVVHGDLVSFQNHCDVDGDHRLLGRVDDAPRLMRRRLTGNTPTHAAQGLEASPPPKRRKWLYLPWPSRGSQESSYFPRVGEGTTPPDSLESVPGGIGVGVPDRQSVRRGCALAHPAPKSCMIASRLHRHARSSIHGTTTRRQFFLKADRFNSVAGVVGPSVWPRCDGCSRRCWRRHVQCLPPTRAAPALVVATRDAERRGRPHSGPSPQRWPEGGRRRWRSSSTTAYGHRRHLSWGRGQHHCLWSLGCRVCGPGLLGSPAVWSRQYWRPRRRRESTPLL